MNTVIFPLLFTACCFIAALWPAKVNYNAGPLEREARAAFRVLFLAIASAISLAVWVLWAIAVLIFAH